MTTADVAVERRDLVALSACRPRGRATRREDGYVQTAPWAAEPTSFTYFASTPVV
jgi:hypothetical protein